MLRLGPLRKVPWLLLFEAARVTHGHVMERTSPADRRRVMQLVRRTRGNPLALTARERRELKAIAAKLDLAQLAAALSPFGALRPGRR
ncbi:MAG: hypothetical protein IRZ32_02915 [Solirubrobacteraceae bacterium]|nr:hypothetical protein [Solirubrobacteraceae bacterium]